MNRKALQEVGVNIEKGLDNVDQDTSLYEELLRYFLKDKSYPRLCAAFQTQNVQEAFNAAHALKGISDNLGFQKLTENVKPVVEYLRQENLDNAKQLFPQIEETYHEVIEAIQA